MRWTVAVMMAALVLAACTRPSVRIADTLMDYGLDRPRAKCVGEQLERHLSISQLIELDRAARDYKRRVDGPVLDFNQMVQVGGTLSPEVQAQLLAAGVLCAVPPTL